MKIQSTEHTEHQSHAIVFIRVSQSKPYLCVTKKTFMEVYVPMLI